MKRLVLVCDDEPVARRKYCDCVAAIENVEVYECDHPTKAIQMLSENVTYDLVLMDLGFPNPIGSEKIEPIGHLYLQSIREMCPKTKIAVITKLDGTQIYDIVVECYRARLMDDWIDAGKTLKAEELKARVESLIYPFGSVTRSGLWLAQLSDLHFGDSESLEYWGLAEDGILLDLVSKDIHSGIGRDYGVNCEGIDLAIFSGDVVHRARDSEYEKVVTFIDGLAANTFRWCSGCDRERRNRRIIIIPGNHDVNWDISRARCIVESKNKSARRKRMSAGQDAAEYIYNSQIDETRVPEHLRYLASYSWVPFERFLGNMCAARPIESSMWDSRSHFAAAAWEFPEYGLSIYGLNTAANSAGHWNKPATINPEAIRILEKHASQKNAQVLRMPSIVVLHHSLGSSSIDSERVNPTELAGLRLALFRRLGARIFLTGHIHKDICEVIDVEKINLLSIGAGSASASKKHTPALAGLHYNLIHMQMGSAGDSYDCKLDVYSRMLMQDQFVMKPVHGMVSYKWRSASGWIID